MLSKYLLQTTLETAKRINNIDSAVLEAGGIVSANTFIPEKDILSKATEEFSNLTSDKSCYSDGYLKIYLIESPNGFKRALLIIGEVPDNLRIIRMYRRQRYLCEATVKKRASESGYFFGVCKIRICPFI